MEPFWLGWNNTCINYTEQISIKLQLQLGYVKLNPIWRLRVRLPHVYTYFLLGAVDVFTDHLSCSRSVYWNVQIGVLGVIEFYIYITPSILTRDVDMEFLSVIPPCVANAKCWYCVQINPHSIKVIRVFLPRDALHSAAIAVVACPSHAGIVSKHIKISSNFFSRPSSPTTQVL